MKKIKLLFTLFLWITISMQAQVPPNAFNYSAVARDAAGEPIATTTIGIQVSILQSSTIGSAIYVENHFVNTDDFGLFNLIIGAGSAQSGIMENIEWDTDNFYLQIGMDANGGTNFMTMGTTQLLSVPYALHAATADSLIGGGPSFSGDYNDLSNQPITISSMSQNGDSLLLSNGQIYTSSNDYNDLINQPITVDSISTNNDTIYMSNGVSLPLMTGNTNNGLDLPTLVTSIGDDLGSNSVTLFGVMDNVTNPNTIMGKGFVLDTLPSPNIQGNVFSIALGVGEENFDYNPLTLALDQVTVPPQNGYATTDCSPTTLDFSLLYSPSTTYYARAYVTLESNITIYSNEINFTTTSLGTGPAGGNIVFDLGHDELGWQYLEVAPEPVWDPGTYENQLTTEFPLWGTNISLGTSEFLGAGPDNTALMMANAGLIVPTSCSSGGGSYDGSHFAGLVDAYTLNGFNDWFLPSVDEALVADYNSGIATNSGWLGGVPTSSEITNDVFLLAKVNGGQAFKHPRLKAGFCWEQTYFCVTWSNPVPIWAFRRY